MALFENKKKRVGDQTPSPVPANGSQSLSPSGVPGAHEPSEMLEFGVDKAIELMRRLPPNNVELVVEVVKTTLESLRVKVSTIIEDAERKEARIDERVLTLKREIADFESEIASRRKQIEALEADHTETRSVKERLQLAQKSSPREALAASAPPPTVQLPGFQPPGQPPGSPPPLPVINPLK